MSKAETSKSVYYDKSGYGPKKATLDDARKKDKTITMVEIMNSFNRMLNRSSK